MIIIDFTIMYTFGFLLCCLTLTIKVYFTNCKIIAPFQGAQILALSQIYLPHTHSHIHTHTHKHTRARACARMPGGPNLYFHFSDIVAASAGISLRIGLVKHLLKLTGMFLFVPFVK